LDGNDAWNSLVELTQTCSFLPNNSFGNDVENSSFADGIWKPAGNSKVPENQTNRDTFYIKINSFFHGEFW